MNDWKEAREVIVGLLKYGTATDQPFTPVGKKALSTALKALDIAEKWTHSAQFRRVELLQADLAQKEKRIGELQGKINSLTSQTG